MTRVFTATIAGALLWGAAGASAALQSQAGTVRARAMPHYRTALEYMRAEAWPEAAQAFDRAIEIDPGFEMAYYGLGRALMPQKKFVNAISAYGKCRDLYIAETGRQFTNQHEAQRYRSDQMVELDDVIRSYQQGPQTMQTAQVLRGLQERRNQLQQTMQRGANFSVMSTPVPAFVSLALGSAFFRAGRLLDAEREYKATIAADPKTGEAYSNLAVVYLQTERFDEAEKAVKSAEKTGFKVNPMLKEDIAAKKR